MTELQSLARATVCDRNHLRRVTKKYDIVRHYHGPDGTVMVHWSRHPTLAGAISQVHRWGAKRGTIQVNLEVIT